MESVVLFNTMDDDEIITSEVSKQPFKSATSTW